MNRKHLARIVLPLVLLLALTGTAIAGGWAIITLSDFPDYTVANARLKLTFTVRQHGKTLLSNLHPTVQATNKTDQIKAYCLSRSNPQWDARITGRSCCSPFDRAAMRSCDRRPVAQF